jgi:hypothetical protein
VDIGSGVEARPGKKDPVKIRELMAVLKMIGDFPEFSSGKIFPGSRDGR